MRKAILCLIKHAPYGTDKARNTLDAAMMLAALNHQISLAFIGDGIWHLLPNQQPDYLPTKAYTKTLKALSIYEINQLYVTTEDLAFRGLSVANLMIPVKTITQSTMAQLMANHQFIFTV